MRDNSTHEEYQRREKRETKDMQSCAQTEDRIILYNSCGRSHWNYTEIQCMRSSDRAQGGPGYERQTRDYVSRTEGTQKPSDLWLKRYVGVVCEAHIRQSR